MSRDITGVWGRCVVNMGQGGVKPTWYYPAILILALRADVNDILTTKFLDSQPLNVREIDFDLVVGGNAIETEVEPSRSSLNFVRGEQWVVVFDRKAGECIPEESGSIPCHRVRKLDRLDRWVAGHLDVRLRFGCW